MSQNCEFLSHNTQDLLEERSFRNLPSILSGSRGNSVGINVEMMFKLFFWSMSSQNITKMRKSYQC
jgi:hypothetical protein